MTPPRAGNAKPLPREEEAAERAARVAAMLARWDAENVGDEPDWDEREVPRFDIRKPE